VGIKDNKPISYQPILPPLSFRIPTDNIALYSEAPPVTNLPPLLSLNDFSKCSCEQEYMKVHPTYELDCIVYTLTKSIATRIQLQKCPSCSKSRYQAIGPDCREYGIFNLNNHSLFSHDLLEDYTISYATSETPFTSWVKVVSSRYQKYQSSLSFVDEKTFRSAWFGYASLLLLEEDMKCPQCKDIPETIIWDGVTLAFSKKHLQQSLHPPTSIHPNAPIRNCLYIRNQAFIENSDCRKLLRSTFSEPLCLTPPSKNLLSDNDSSEDESHTTITKNLQKLITRLENLPILQDMLNKENQSLGLLFKQYCTTSAISKHNNQCPKEVVSFFYQVFYQFLINCYQYYSHIE